MRFFTLTIVIAASHLAWPGEAAARDVTTPPYDTADARRVRIWLPLLRQGRCRVIIDILNDSNQVIRRLADRLLGIGYHNFYWDKLTDDGEFAPEGEYTYQVDNCGKRSTGTVTVKYAQGERAVRFSERSVRDTLPIFFEMLRDSAPVTIIVYNRRQVAADTVVVDSVFTAGLHSFDWLPDRRQPRNYYIAEFRIGDYIRRMEFGYIPRQQRSPQ